MADFGRGIEAGVVTGIIYMAIAGILGSVYVNDPLSLPRFLYGAGLTLFTWRSLVDLSTLIPLILAYIYRGLVFGAVFAALYNSLPGTASVKKGMMLSLSLCMVAVVGALYTTPGWPSHGQIPDGFYYVGVLNLSSPGLALAGIVSALIFGALTGFLWDRFRRKQLGDERMGRPVLLVSWILGAAIWVLPTVVLLLTTIMSGEFPTVDPRSWWVDLLNMSVVFLGLPGWILTRAAWKKTKADQSGLKRGVAGGVLMALTGIMLLPGILAILGGAVSRREPTRQLSTAETT
ncbi:MAG: hypothetical protein ACNA7X_01740 [Dehalococcoidia bacterium]